MTQHGAKQVAKRQDGQKSLDVELPSAHTA